MQQFIQKAKNIHGDLYDYSLVLYHNAKTKLQIICKTHGVFEQRPDSHLSGNGCSKCAYDKKSLDKLSNTKKFIKKAQTIHNNLYDYTKFEYVTSNTKSKIICKIHGVFEQTAGMHIQGQGCAKCAHEKTAIFQRSNTEEFIIKSKEIHGDLYDYIISDYNGRFTKLKIICKLHGEFEQQPNNHLSGNGCPFCHNIISKSETEIVSFLKQYNIAMITNDRKLISPLEIDIILPAHNIGIEFCGLYWHSELFKNDKNYHLNKLQLMNKMNYKLITIFEDEWLHKRDIVQSRLLHLLGLSTKGKGARQLTIKSISAKEAKDFLDMYHIQGNGTYGYAKYGAYDLSELVAVMTFSKPRLALGRKKNIAAPDELLRFASNGKNYPGLASRLFRTFVKEYKPKEIISYADRRWSDGNLYKQLGFELESITGVNYWHTKGAAQRHYRFNFRKDRIKHLVENGNTKTEIEIMRELGYSRIWDCGSLKFLWKSTN